MGSIERLNDGQRAVLQLLLRQGKSYDDIAGLLHTDAGGVRRRAHGAVEALGPDSAEVSGDRRHEIADYLLGQQTASRRAATREYLGGSPAGRGWARAAAGALALLAGDDALPDIPAEREEVAEAFHALDRSTARQEEVQRNSQLGGRLIAAGLGLVLAIAIILLVSLTGGDDKGETASTTSPSPPAAQTTPTGDRVEFVTQGSLRPPQGGDSDAKGEAAIVRFPDNNRYRFALQADGLPPSSTRGSAYGVWLYTSPTLRQFLGFPDTVVDKDGTLKTVSDLSPNTASYREVLLTRETAESPKEPGTIILRGRLIAAVERAQQQQGQTQTRP